MMGDDDGEGGSCFFPSLRFDLGVLPFSIPAADALPLLLPPPLSPPLPQPLLSPLLLHCPSLLADTTISSGPNILSSGAMASSLISVPAADCMEMGPGTPGAEETALLPPSPKVCWMQRNPILITNERSLSQVLP